MTTETELNLAAIDLSNRWEPLSVIHERYLHDLSPEVAGWLRSAAYRLYLLILESDATVNASLAVSMQAVTQELSDLAVALRPLEGEMPAEVAAVSASVCRELDASVGRLGSGLQPTGAPPEPAAQRRFLRCTFTTMVDHQMLVLMPGALPLLEALRVQRSAAATSSTPPGLAPIAGVALDLHYTAWYLGQLGRYYSTCQPLARQDVRLSLLAGDVAPAVWASAEQLMEILPETARCVPEVRLFEAGMPFDGGHHAQAE